jgi:hypothetical protein
MTMITHRSMRPFTVLCAVALLPALCPVLASAAELEPPAPIGKPATKVYRQVLPDGRIVYSDKQVKGAKIDETITAEPATEGKSWKSDTGKPPVVPPRIEPTPIDKRPSIPDSGKARTLADANADVIKAEMMLEDARKRQQAGAEPLPGERTGTVSGHSRLNEAYWRRQQELADDVAAAEAMLKKVMAEQNALQGGR